jgi:hypothetical protein
MSTEEIKKKSDSSKKEPKKVDSKKADSKKKSKFKAKKKEKKVVINGKAFVNATFNNTIISITDKDGNNIKNKFLHFVYDFENLNLEGDDFQKRKRIKNVIPNYDRCGALRCNKERCTRKKKTSELDRKSVG